MLSSILYYVYRLPLSTVLLCMAVITPLFGFAFGLFSRKRSNQLRIADGILVILYIAVIVFMTLCKREYGSGSPAELIPFSFFSRAKEQPELYRSTLMNVFLFWPLGLLLPHAFMNRKHPILKTILIALVLSVIIEAVQFFFSLGLAETDDVISNTLGTAIGTIAFVISNRVRTLGKHN